MLSMKAVGSVLRKGVQKFSSVWKHARQWLVKQAKKGVVLLYIILGLAAISLAVWGTPQLWKLLKDENKPTFVVEVVKTLATIGGAVFIIWNIRLTQERLITERFSKAIEQLGSDKLEVRLGGIYALERIAKDSEKDHWTIMEVLTSFVQEKSPLQQKKNAQEDEPHKITKDVQAALTVIARRDYSKDLKDKRLDLSCANLSRAKLSKANLGGANLGGADLRGAILWDANFGGAILGRANLSGAELLRANLSHAHLIRTNLSETNLVQASLRKASLLEANLREANIAYCDLFKALNLTPDQVKSANHWEKAIYDEDFRKKLGLPPESAGKNQDT